MWKVFRILITDIFDTHVLCLGVGGTQWIIMKLVNLWISSCNAWARVRDNKLSISKFWDHVIWLPKTHLVITLISVARWKARCQADNNREDSTLVSLSDRGTWRLMMARTCGGRWWSCWYKKEETISLNCTLHHLPCWLATTLLPVLYTSHQRPVHWDHVLET